jgi:very-short-patch-repair endonuclease
MSKLQEPFSIAPNIDEYFLAMREMEGRAWYTGIVEELENHHIVSPPEQLFYVTWDFVGFNEDVSLMPQFEIGSYRVDFFLSPLTYFVNHAANFSQHYPYLEELLKPQYVIEIDGHIWHEKTKDQVQYDKRRERELVKRGYTLLRYTASEVLKKPHECVQESYEQVSAVLMRAQKQFIIRAELKAHAKPLD